MFFRDRAKAQLARAQARPSWQKRLVALIPVVIFVAVHAAAHAVVHAEDGVSSAPPKPAAVRSACGYIDRELISTLFAAPDPTLTEDSRQLGIGFTRYICLVTTEAKVSLRLDLDAYAGTPAPGNDLLALALTHETSYSVEGTDGVLVAAKRSVAILYAVTLTGSSGAGPAPEDKLVQLAFSVTSAL